MTQEDKKLLLKDLCARLPYGVKIQTDYIDAKTLEGIQFPNYFGISDGYYSLDDIECKPYLFPLSSMTEEQKTSHNFLKNSAYANPIKLINFYHKNHFDYNGLIPKGLAIDATGLNIY